MKSKMLTVVAGTVLMATTVSAAELPSQGNVELGFAGSFVHTDYSDDLRVSVDAGWFVTDRQQIGGGLMYGRTEADEIYESDYYGISVLYRYNFIDSSRSFYPYVGVRVLYQEYDTQEESLGEIYSANTDSTFGEAQGGIKFMLADNVAWDSGLTYQRVLDGSGEDEDFWALHTGLSVFF